jgi:hypothetical protein
MFGQAVEPFGGAGKLVRRRSAAFDDARVTVEAAGVSPSAELGAEVDLALVPGETAGPVAGVVRREVGAERPAAAGSDDEVEAERSGAAGGQARVEHDVVADLKLEHVEAELPGEIEETDFAVRPAPGEERAVSAVLHEKKIPQRDGPFKPTGEHGMMRA